jgi:hypothetical protein
MSVANAVDLSWLFTSGYCRYPEGILQTLRITGGGSEEYKKAVGALTLKEGLVAARNQHHPPFVSEVKATDSSSLSATAPLVLCHNFNPMLYENIEIPLSLPCKKWLSSLVSGGIYRYTEYNRVSVVNASADPYMMWVILCALRYKLIDA